MNNTVSLMMSLIGCDVCKNEALSDKTVLPSDEEKKALLDLSARCGVAHIIAYSLDKRGLLGGSETDDRFRRHMYAAIYRYEQKKYESERIYKLLEDLKIPFMPLKGSVTYALYPEKFMRTSSDIDILVKTEDFDRAAEALCEVCLYKRGVSGTHDVSFFSQGGEHIELHFSLIEDNIVAKANKPIEDVWSDAKLYDGGYLYHMSAEKTIYYTVAHMAKHFIAGGCGVRPLIDLWLLKKFYKYDENLLSQMLTDGGLSAFFDAAERLCEAWFSGGAYDDTVSEMQRYILDGGVYGTLENRMKAKPEKKRSFVSRILLPYRELVKIYPVLNTKKYLFPIMQIRRVFKIVFCGGIKASARKRKIYRGISTEGFERAENLINSLGLK